MRRFRCAICGAEVAFTSAECNACGASIGYLPLERELVPLHQRDDIGYTVAGSAPAAPPADAPLWWRCLNFAWGCNWMVPAEAGDVWCPSCRLTRGRPDESSIDAVLAWSTAEQAKRSLVFQLGTLDLPIGTPASDVAPETGGVVFDLVYLPESAGVTGHRPGVVTVDLREVDDRFRESARLHFRESDRTLIGHLRHEIGHHYFELLVTRSGATDEFRAMFGDERTDYAAALAAHYEHLGRPVPDTHISSYATAHPSEDWAETFAHYLHMRDGLETADAFGIDRPTGRPESFTGMVQRWRRITKGLDEISVGLGHVPPYPFTISAAMEAKMAFVHRRIDARHLHA
ncbi:MAG: hypothetical protein RLZZ623_2113 [Actinomycetota bacterium]|jgi:hypothetical protein